MRSLFCYIRLKSDYSLLRCSISIESTEPGAIMVEAQRKLASVGHIIHQSDMLRFVWVLDPRNHQSDEEPARDPLARAIAAHPDISAHRFPPEAVSRPH